MAVTEARGHRCPACGGYVDESARICGYCHAPVATLRCAHCFHMNIPEARHCSGCGRQLGLEPLGEPGELKCPECAVVFDQFRGGTGTLCDCAQCGGQFVEHALLKELLERREAIGLAPQRTHRPAADARPVRYRPCPSCGSIMNRRNFGRISGVIVDVCHAHGIWFDIGELPRVMAFVQDGGLVKAERRELESLKRQQKHTQSTAHGFDLHAVSSRDYTRREPLTDLAEAGRELLSFVSQLIRR